MLLVLVVVLSQALYLHVNVLWSEQPQFAPDFGSKLCIHIGRSRYNLKDDLGETTDLSTTHPAGALDLDGSSI